MATHTKTHSSPVTLLWPLPLPLLQALSMAQSSLPSADATLSAVCWRGPTTRLCQPPPALTHVARRAEGSQESESALQSTTKGQEGFCQTGWHCSLGRYTPSSLKVTILHQPTCKVGRKRTFHTLYHLISLFPHLFICIITIITLHFQTNQLF